MAKASVRLSVRDTLLPCQNDTS